MISDCQKTGFIDRIISTLGDLPASPAIVSTVMSLTSNPDSRVPEISRVLSADQSLTAKVLKLSNSSFYGRPKGVGTLQEAIMLLGFFTVRSIVVATSAHTIYTQDACGGPKEKLWEHSLATAVAARQVAKHVRLAGNDEVFISALLHDIGKLVMLQKLPDAYTEVIEEVESLKRPFVEIETRRLGFDHCLVADMLLAQWKFPAEMRRAILDHHQPTTPDGGPPTAAQIVCLGNYLAKRLGTGFDDGQGELDPPEALTLLTGGDERQLDALLKDVRAFYESEVRIFEEA